MPLVRNSDLPAYARLAAEGRQILDPGRALTQDIRELHIGFLNMMPDAAMEATERQFFRLVGESSRVAQIHMHPFTLPIIERGAAARAHIGAYYEPFEKLREDGLDALVVTGANVGDRPISNEDFWKPLKEVFSWAHENVTSTLCSCLASHAVMSYLYGEPPRRHEDKRWGVFPHRVADRGHPVVRGMNTVFDVPHSRFGEITREQFHRAGMKVLVESPDVGVHMAVSGDGFRLICFQGHPEYDIVSLLKEYRREVGLYAAGKRPDYPPYPSHYFNAQAQDIAARYRAEVEAGTAGEFPEEEIAALLDNTWADSARAVVGSWIGHVYQITHVDRRKPFMDGIDPNNPLQGL